MPASPAAAQPLSGKSALLVCSPLKIAPLTVGLESMGARVSQIQAISIRPIENPAALDRALASLDSYSWIVFTSSYAVLIFSRRMSELRVPVEKLAQLQVCAVGPATARMAAEHGIPVSLVPDEFLAEGVLEAIARRVGSLNKLHGQRILLPRAKEAREVLPRELSSAGAVVDIAVCYETTPAEVDWARVEEVRKHPPDLMVFTSSSNVTGFATIMGTIDATRLISNATVAVLGPVTAKTVESYGKRPEILPCENTIASLLEAVRRHFR